MKLHTLLQAIPFIQIPPENPEIQSIVNDHRQVLPGSLFICIKGYVFDGHTVAKDAARNGATAILSERELDLDVPVILVKDTKHAMAILADAFYGHPTQKLHLIGITGTNGKTTTSHLIEKIFSDHNQSTGLIGTIHMKIGNREIETKNTTPDSLVLQSVFNDMTNENIDTAIMEVSSHALVQGRVNGCDYDIAVFTNLSQDHLDYHHTMEEYAQAKSLLFSKLGNSYIENKPKFAVLNADDMASNQMMTVTSAHIITYGIEQQADFTASNIVLKSGGTSFTLHSPEGKREITLKLMGKFNIYNALAAIASAYVSNIPLHSIIRSLESAAGVDGRFEPVMGGQDFPVIVDYAHTPDSLENVLKTIGQFAKKRIFAVVGCGGDRDPSKRPLMAAIACKYATDPIFTADNPRSEDPLAILEDMEKGALGMNYQIVPDRTEAIKKAVGSAKSGDVVLIAGKGHETYQIIGDKVFDFDDRLVALEAIKER
ncbi:UDP-N-acetylmuramoyl-L-alanyl-D-glutamate--2,6-diaminopimelate ligase [Lederbergia citrea]|uniref:UDP-N-acetylmuramoyl-L-alanyl-D-glutamate--2,6-diaminopimelate ligase n=1 Tax=Lederbergia citrea TaxID=2833581 RepID=A0A942UMQ7_9BACI|nr:UDP-N-acetylmuramoyl-L-alanyl-D-glutamate--2,6-diaminopimelate ligase [Lederbergia citrea]MBS4177214.1 UDP-N-acetylmuramoyl-L-alanyl-D-glutamate--2,6-diaminopimelate ligase [Lederbergia citrea]MBS4203877.1 UDP-N-acetylmuramoyl-L-alanyl-D-glutamate--2,6-diaminopimelate ligase [Lederbergia citrea]MBS4221538.1 UDP-N-acetylmuramoyl-L-alanyl-D-glutamate--2,6-diaminopimelate ligase [Lederbergia citrea]